MNIINENKLKGYVKNLVENILEKQEREVNMLWKHVGNLKEDMRLISDWIHDQKVKKGLK